MKEINLNDKICFENKRSNKTTVMSEKSLKFV